MAGRPKGAWSEKKFRDALNCAVTEQTKDGQRKLRVIAERLVEAAMNGDIPAIKEVADRLDGKPAQALTLDAHIIRDPNSLTDAELAAIATSGSGHAAGTETPEEQLH